MREAHHKHRQLNEQLISAKLARAKAEAQLTVIEANPAKSKRTCLLEAVETASGVGIHFSPEASSSVEAAGKFESIRELVQETVDAENTAIKKMGKRTIVVYLPDCKQLVNGGAEYMQMALVLAYASDAEKCKEVASLDVFDAEAEGDILLSDWLSHQRGRDHVIFIVDQYDELDFLESNSSAVAMSAVAGDPYRNSWRRFFDQQCGRGSYIIRGISPSASNSINAHERDHALGEVVYMYEGLNEVEWKCWQASRAASRVLYHLLSDSDREHVAWITGLLPSHLRSMEDVAEGLTPALISNAVKLAQGALKAAADANRATLEVRLRETQQNVTSALTIIDPAAQRCSLILALALLGQNGSSVLASEIDHRYFYFDRASRQIRCINGLVQQVVAEMLTDSGADVFLLSQSQFSWAIQEELNQTVKGFLVERACIAGILRSGMTVQLHHAAKSHQTLLLKPTQVVLFNKDQQKQVFVEDAFCVLYVPCAFSNGSKYIDAVMRIRPQYYQSAARTKEGRDKEEKDVAIAFEEYSKDALIIAIKISILANAISAHPNSVPCFAEALEDWLPYDVIGRRIAASAPGALGVVNPVTNFAFCWIVPESQTPGVQPMQHGAHGNTMLQEALYPSPSVEANRL